MGQSAEELRREIEDTRHDLGQTLDAIGDRVSPGRIVERRKNRVMNGLHSVRDRVMGTAADTGAAIGETAGGAVDTLKATPDVVAGQTQGNPMAAGAVAFGVGVLLASIFPASAKEKQAAEELMDRVQPLTDELKQAGQEMAEHLKEPAREAVEQVKQVAAEGQQAVTDTVKEVADTSKQSAREATDAVRAEATDGGHDELR
jgi:ElaB/YqjD/DUF883 family membrane-anchored ribosome-binding protein